MLNKAVDVGVGKYGLAVVSFSVKMVDENYLVLGQRAGLISAQDIHAPEVLDRFGVFDYGALLRHRNCTFREVERKDHREEFRCHPHGKGDRKEKGVKKAMPEKRIDKKDDDDQGEDDL